MECREMERKDGEKKYGEIDRKRRGRMSGEKEDR